MSKNNISLLFFCFTIVILYFVRYYNYKNVCSEIIEPHSCPHGCKKQISYPTVTICEPAHPVNTTNWDLNINCPKQCQLFNFSSDIWTHVCNPVPGFSDICEEKNNNCPLDCHYNNTLKRCIGNTVRDICETTISVVCLLDIDNGDISISLPFLYGNKAFNVDVRNVPVCNFYTRNDLCKVVHDGQSFFTNPRYKNITGFYADLHYPYRLKHLYGHIECQNNYFDNCKQNKKLVVGCSDNCKLDFLNNRCVHP